MAGTRGTPANRDISKKRKFVKDGIFNAELNEFLSRTLSQDGYSSALIKVTPLTTQIIIRATRTREVVGERCQRIRELTSLVQKRFGFKPDTVELLAERVENRGLCSMAQAESLRYKLLKGLPVRRACYSVLRNIMESGAKGCEVTVAGKLRAQRAKTMKFSEGYMISSGHPSDVYVEEAIRSVMMRQGVLGVRVKIMLPHDPEGIEGPKELIPDNVVVIAPKADPLAPVLTNQNLPATDSIIISEATGINAQPVEA